MLVLDPGKYYGTVLQTVRSGDFLFVLKSHRPGSVLKKHMHEHPYFCYCLKGSWNEATGRQMDTCTPGHLIYHPSKEIHATYFHKEKEIITLNIEPLEPGSFAERFTVFQKRNIVRNETISATCRDFAGLVSKKQVTAQQAHSIIRKIADFKESKAAISRVGLVKAHIDQYSGPDKLRVHDLATMFNAHPVHLNRLFKATFHVSLSRYILKQHIFKMAYWYISHPNTTLSALTSNFGFTDVSHLNRACQSLFGSNFNQFCQ